MNAIRKTFNFGKKIIKTKTTTPISTRIILFIFCLFCMGNTYGQDKKRTGKTLFGKSVNAENVNPKSGQIRCATTEYEKFLQKKNPKRMTNAQFETWLTPLVSKYKAMRSGSKTAATVIIIPVVVHVIYDGQAIGVAPNISDAQVQSQITVLNQDFRKMLGTPGYNTNPVSADIEIQFELAKQDPNGNPTNGIDRVSLCQPTWSDIDIEETLKPATIWDPTKYMNMWSLDFTDSTLLGYAQFPQASGLSGLGPSGGNSNTDGVVVSYDAFGSKAYNDGSFILDATYNKGRTMTHEVGHWLGLIHIWGDTTCGNDYCADTPVHHDANYGCPTVVNCDANGNEMVQNYMDYTDDACMNIFTQNQKDRILTVMNNSPQRKELKTSTKNNAISLFAFDAEVKLEASCPVNICGAVANQATQLITIYNRGTTTLTSATLNYNINGGKNIAYNWSGSLAINKSVTFSETINSTSSGNISISIGNVNGVTDQRISNNTDSGSFIIPPTPSNYTFNTFKFTLQQDFFGSETTWNLKDGTGTIVHSGGPYKDTYAGDNKLSVLPALITENWTLAIDECYTFTINDSVGDGICCGSGIGASGNGYYNIKSSDGLITVKSGASFTSRENILLTTKTIATLKFEASKDIYFYPNPTKGTLNMRVSDGFGFPNSYIIYNSLGQIVIQKEVSNEADLSINTSALSSGVYFISVTKDDQTKTAKFIKD